MDNVFEVVRWSNDRTIVHIEMLIDFSKENIKKSTIDVVIFNFKFYDKDNNLLSAKEAYVNNIPATHEIVKELQLCNVPLEAYSMTTSIAQIKNN